ncbi:hypothetical protein HBI25_157490 [Parastagonospora nodorum]|nr:hypothetical protein HBH51_230510 [Parastagonospora nodorum]KAH3968309.1 hypothetical protein HBH52_181560 [Parastagonospora nodorum]KAH4012759.1 hypothetical protein HBI09_220270 [Parastagonospora nodorum]KAH4101221.1 hypothetical protein HBH46_144210 [Parastagonospora nodorum]KAH4163625.1 hypothetical protein HBH43_152920 [Parastagonospora nodorum]
MKFGKLTDEAVINIFTMFYPTFLLSFDSVIVLFKDSPGFRILCRDVDRPTPKAVSSTFLAMDELFRTINNAKNHDQYRPAPRFKYLPFHQQSVRASPNGILGDLFFPLCGNRIGIAYGVRKPENQDATVFFYPYGYTENYGICSEDSITNYHNWALTNPGEMEIAPRTFNKRYITEPPAEPCKAVRLCSAS